MLARSYATGPMPTERTSLERDRLAERLLVEAALDGDHDAREELRRALGAGSHLDESLEPFVRAVTRAR